MVRLRHGLLPILALLVGAGASHADEVRGSIEAANRALVSAFLARDANAVSAFYTENAELIGPGQPVARGRSAIAAAWQKTIDAGIRELSLETTDVESAGDFAYETGVVRLVSGEGHATQGRYVVVWKREGGRWKLHRDIWNSE